MDQEKKEKKKKSKQKNIWKVVIAILTGLTLLVVQSAFANIHLSLEYYKSSLFIESYLFLQIFGCMLLFAHLLYKKLPSLLVIFLLAMVYGAYVFLEVYTIITRTALDYTFFKSGLVDAPFLLRPHTTELAWVFFLAFVAGIFFFLSHRMIFQEQNKKIVSMVILVLFLALPFFLPDNMQGKLHFFVKSAFLNDDVLDYYRTFYDNAIEQSVKEKKEVLTEAEKLRDKELPKYLENIVFLQLESVNANVVGEKVTPNLLSISKQGLFFPRFYGNSVQTILGQENIFCGLPNSMDTTLVKSRTDKEVLCFPEVLKAAGYENFFMKTYNLKFSGTGDFMRNLKFDHVLADDLMQANDPEYIWGYREDVFYERAFSYFKEHKQDSRNFLYLEVGPTNHWPFESPKDFEGNVPYPEPQNHRERISNTTFIQDGYLKSAWEKMQETFPEKNFTLFILSDHGWPIGLQAGNEFNERGSYEDNFITPLAVVLGTEDGEREIVSNQKYSLMDIMPTIFEMLGLSSSEKQYRESFAKNIFGENGLKRSKTILVQPYSSKYLNIVEGEKKFQYDYGNKEFLFFDLVNDQKEESPKILSKKEKENVLNFSRKLDLFENENIIMHALGEVDGQDYTNSKEAFQKHFKRGRRIFEADLSLTADQRVIAQHSNSTSLTNEEFLSQKIDGKFTSLGLDDLLGLLKENKEMILVTDAKQNESRITKMLVGRANEIDPDLLRRIIPQVYSEQSYKETMDIFPFDSVVYTLYKTDSSDEEVAHFVEEVDNIYAVTMSKKRFSKDAAKMINEKGVNVFVHTLNSPKEIEKYARMGADGIYTDRY